MIQSINKYLILGLLGIFILLCGQKAHAQTGMMEISQIKFLYDQLRFEEAIQLGQKYLNETELSEPHQLEYIHQYLAFSFFNLGKTDSARIHFLSLLTITPEKEFNPLQTSPKIIDFFNQTKNDFTEINDRKKFISYPAYIFIEDKRPDAAWRSAVLPGWGQLYKGQSTRGYILGGSFITSAAILGISFFNENKYKDEYLNSTDPEQISANYDRYNTWSKIKRVSTYTTAGIWLISFTDALWTDYKGVELTLSGSNNASMLSFKYSF